MTDRDEYAADLAGHALRIAADLRDLDPDQVARHMDGMDADQLRALVMVACAHIPVDLPPSVLTGWWTHPQRRPHALAGWAELEWQRMEAA